MTTLTEVRAAALAWRAAGASVVPVKADGSKAPEGDWKTAQTQPASRETVAKWFATSRQRTGFGIVLGYNGYECLEFETNAATIAYGEAAKAAGLDALLQRVIDGYQEVTPGGGVHLIWRCTEPDAVSGNKKLAAEPDGKTIAETRGRGGFVILAPSYGAVHPSGRSYVVESGSPATVATITPEEREALLALARSLDRRPVKPPHEKPLRLADGTRPGDAYNRDGPSWAEILKPAGWSEVYERDGLTYWRRPDKTAGVSATTGVRGDGGDDLLWVFSTNAEPFEAERSYDKFGAYAVLEHDGDYKAAAQALADKGYGDDEQADRFTLVSAVELAQPVPPMRWLVRGVWPERSHGPLAGAKKSLKSWNALALAVAVASGLPYLGVDKFAVELPGPVLVFNGEGGQVPYQRRFQRIAKAYGVNPADLPIWATFGVGPLDGPVFREAMKAHLDKVQPVLVILDPLYVYHPANVEAQNLYERGRMLGGLSNLVGHETALVVVDHYRKTGGRNLDLDEIGQSGVAQWADSWILQAHREDPDLEAGRFRLSVEFGSRQWGGDRWAVDWDCGKFDYDAGTPESDITWSVEAFDGRSGRGRARARKLTDDDLRQLVFTWIANHPPTTRTQVVREVAAQFEVGDNRVAAAFKAIKDAGQIVPRKEKVPEGERKVTREVWVAASDRIAQPGNPRSPERQT